ncbi:terminase small subunit [Mucilaginibacter sp.]|uniref:terminase small subunit n=1 Tax=Mucilaginibacter sp. TaxID=1882438 RepID=UPI003568408D
MPAPKGNTYWMDRSISGVPKLLSPELLAQHFANYVKWVKDNPVEVQDFVGKDATEVFRKKEQPLSLDGFEDYVAENGGPISLGHYFSNREGRYEDFVALCDYIRRKIRADQIKGGMVGIYNASITQRLNGLAEKTETTARVTTETVDTHLLSDEILKALEDAASNKPIES